MSARVRAGTDFGAAWNVECRLGRTSIRLIMTVWLVAKAAQPLTSAPAGLVNLHLMRGENDIAAGWFAKAIEQRDTPTPWILHRMFGNQLTSSSYWPALARMMNLPERAS